LNSDKNFKIILWCANRKIELTMQLFINFRWRARATDSRSKLQGNIYPTAPWMY